jgi:hypothetical protein
MALHDHFRPPLSTQRHWHAFHNAWATYLSSDLNQRLPEGYFAEANVQFGIGIDVAAFDEASRAAIGDGPADPGSLPSGGTAIRTAPAPTKTVPISLIENVVEILVFSDAAGPTLAGAIELVSPANKDRPSHRDAFVYKCAAYLQQGVGLVIVDVVTDRHANLHEELLGRLRSPDEPAWDAELYATAYRTIVRCGQPYLDIWQQTLTIGDPLPTLPLWLQGDLCVSADLEATYVRTCQEQRILDDAA